MRRRLQELTEATSPEDMLMFIRLDNDARQLNLLDALGDALLDRGLDERAREMFERAKRRRPWQATSYIGTAKALYRLRRYCQKPQFRSSCLLAGSIGSGGYKKPLSLF